MENLDFSLKGSKRADVPDGSHTENFILMFGSTECLAKVIGLDGKEDQFDDINAVLKMASQVEAYRTALLQRHIQVPDGHAYLATVLDGRPCLVELVPYLGNALSCLLENRDEWAYWQHCIGQVLADFGKLIDADHPVDLVPVGMDPKPSNYVVQGGDTPTLYYIDLVWPLTDGSLANLVHPEIQPIWEFRYFNPVGILINMLVQFSRLRPAYRTRISTMILESISSPALRSRLEALPNFRWAQLTRSQRIAAIESTPDCHLDMLRDMGLLLLTESDRPEDVNFIFEGTRTNPRLPLPTARIMTVRQHLCRLAAE